MLKTLVSTIFYINNENMILMDCIFVSSIFYSLNIINILESDLKDGMLVYIQ